MIEYFVKRPVTTLMLVGLFMVLGFVSYFNLNIEETPKINFPMVSIEVLYPGATPYEVETQIVNKIEDAIAEISEIENIESYSYDGFCYVLVEFLLSADVNVKSIEVKDKVEVILNDLPEDAEKPIIQKFDPMVEPVLYLVLSSDTHTGRELYEYADKVFKDELSRVEDVASVDIFGGEERQINVKLDPLLMKQYYISIDDVIEKISARNKNVPGGSIDRRNFALSVRYQGEFANVEEIENMILTSKDGVHFRMKDIGTVEDGAKKIETVARFNGKDVVTLSVKKVSDGNAVNVAKEISRRLPKFEEALPDGMHVRIASDTTEFIVGETKDAQSSILIGIVLTAIILFLFTGHVKLLFISSIVIPTSVLSALFLVDMAGFSINMMTLLAIATALGTLIANAIVIIEHVLERMEMGENSFDAAINGTKRCTFAVLASAGTNLVVFTPIAFMGGIVGQFFKSFGLTVVYATLFSILASFTLTPMLCAYLLRGLKVHQTKKWGFNPFYWCVRITDICVEFLKREYLLLTRVMFRFPKITLLLVCLSIFSLKFILPFIGNEFYPSSDRDQIMISLTLPQGSTVYRTLDTTKLLEERIEKIAEVESVLTTIGENGTENAAMTVNLTESKNRTRSDVDIINELIPFAATFPDADIAFSRGGGGGPGSSDIDLNVYGEDYETMVALSKKMKLIMEESGYFRSVVSTHKYPKTEVQFRPDQDKLIEYDVDNKLLGSIMRDSIYGDDTNTFKEKGEEYAINVELDKRYKNDFLDIYEIDVISRKGMIPLTELGTIVGEKAIPTIRHRDKRRIIQLNGFLAKSTAGEVQQMLVREFAKLDIKSGYGYKFVGSSEEQEKTGKEIGKAFLIAVILTYMLLAAVLNSFIYPIAIGSTIVTSFVGVFLFLFFADKSINLASMLGMVMLVGLVVNDAILLVEYAIYKMKEGMDVKEAIISATRTKFRPILLTSLSIMSGTLPQLWAIIPLKNAMAAVIIGGMMAATFFTFMAVPVLFWYLERLRRFSMKMYRMIVTRKEKE
jgi:HAE1 family hydrophobic/amphiphilic exporter-1